MMHMGFVAAKGELMPVLIKGALLARHGGADGDVVVVVCWRSHDAYGLRGG